MATGVKYSAVISLGGFDSREEAEAFIRGAMEWFSMEIALQDEEVQKLAKSMPFKGYIVKQGE